MGGDRCKDPDAERTALRQLWRMDGVNVSVVLQKEEGGPHVTPGVPEPGGWTVHPTRSGPLRQILVLAPARSVRP